jgi:hypothetical protein
MQIFSSTARRLLPDTLPVSAPGITVRLSRLSHSSSNTPPRHPIQYHSSVYLHIFLYSS